MKTTYESSCLVPHLSLDGDDSISSSSSFSLQNIEKIKGFIIKLSYIQSETVHVGLEQHLHKWDHQGEDEIDIYHLDVGGGWQAVAHIDEECGQHQHGGQVHRHCGLEEERFEEGGGVADHIEQHGRHKGGQDDGQKIAAQVHHNFNLDSGIRENLYSWSHFTWLGSSGNSCIL